MAGPTKMGEPEAWITEPPAPVEDLPPLKWDDFDDPLAPFPADRAAQRTPAASDSDTIPSSVANGVMPVARQAGEYRFSQACKLCGTRIDFTSAQIGATTACPDCFSPMEIREPGPGVARLLLSDDRFGEPESLRMEGLPTPAQRLDAPEALKQRADQLLDKAAAALRAEQRQEQDGRFTDAAAGRLRSVFGQRATLLRLAALSLLGMAAFAMLDWHVGRVLAGFGGNVLSYLTATVAAGVFGIWFAALATVGVSLLRGSMRELSAPISWPVAKSSDWLWHPLRLAWALSAAGLPGMVSVAGLVFLGVPIWLVWPLVLISEVLLLPLAVLAMERRDNSWSVFDSGLLEDFMAVWPATITFYQVAALLGIVGSLTVIAASLGSPWLAVLQGPVVTASALAGSRILGWLHIAMVTPDSDD